jgi:predicted RNase H-like HicB family nuclease
MASFSAVIHKEDGYYEAKCPEVGTASQGRNLEEALKNLKEATELYLEEFPFKRCGNPIMTVFEVATHALVKEIKSEKTGCVVPLHREIKIGTLKAILEQACIPEEEYSRHQ